MHQYISDADPKKTENEKRRQSFNLRNTTSLPRRDRTPENQKEQEDASCTMENVPGLRNARLVKGWDGRGGAHWDSQSWSSLASKGVLPVPESDTRGCPLSSTCTPACTHTQVNTHHHTNAHTKEGSTDGQHAPTWKAT